VPSEQQQLQELALQLLIENVEEYAIFMLDPSGNVATWNSGAARIKGYSPDEIIGQHFSVFYTDDDVNGGKPARELALAAEVGQCRDEGWRVRKDGTTFWANVVITALRDADGQLAGFAKITRDETERKTAEEQMRQLELLTDRERIASAIGSDIVHRIFEAGLAMQGALKLISDPAASKRIEGAIETLDETVKEIRSIVLGLEAP